MQRLALILALFGAIGLGSAVWAEGEPQAPPVAGEQQASPAASDQQSLQQQIDELKARLAKLEEAAAKQKAAPRPVSPVQPAFPNTKIKIDGRLFADLVKTGAQGSFPNASLDIPDAKLRFTFAPSKDVTIVNRFSTNRAGSNGFDYFYVDLNNYLGAFPGNTLRLGKFKIDVGQETWADNPVEGILITNSAPHVSGYDEGLNFLGPLGKRATYSVALMNGTKGFSPADSGPAWSAKVGLPLTAQTYLSASYLRTGDLVTPAGKVDQPDFSIGGLTAPPAGATSWRRSLWELDARYGYGKTGTEPVLTGAPPATRWRAGATYGQFDDAATGAPDRKGSYWFVEGLYDLTPKTYLASRYSTISLHDGLLDKLVDSPVAVNGYDRLSLGVGYRLTNMTQLKAEYSRNTTRGGATSPNLNQIAIGLATKF